MTVTIRVGRLRADFDGSVWSSQSAALADLLNGLDVGEERLNPMVPHEWGYARVIAGMVGGKVITPVPPHEDVVDQ